MEIIGKLIFLNNQVYIEDETHVQVNLFAWLASHGLKDKKVSICVERLDTKEVEVNK
jgi:hypothetical protein